MKTTFNQFQKCNTHKIIIIDFDDSFVQNIAGFFIEKNMNVEVRHWKKEFDWQKELDEFKKVVLVLGPGPCYPQDYPVWQKTIKNLPTNRFFCLGICLGHQLLLSSFGLKIKKRDQPLHGVSSEIVIPNWGQKFPLYALRSKQNVQWYNSLYFDDSDLNKLPPQIEVDIQNKMIVMANYPNGISYQFHPESVGTSCPDIFFHPVVHFIDNIDTNGSTKDRWNI